MTDEEKKSLGIFYTVDKERKVIIYDTYCNNHGKFDHSIKDTTKNMAEIAAKENMPVETKFNKTLFQVNPGMTAEDGYNAWEEAQKKAREEYKKSSHFPSYHLINVIF